MSKLALFSRILSEKIIKTLIFIFLLAAFIGNARTQQLPPGDVQKITDAAPNKAPAKPKRNRKLLVFSLSLGYKHQSIPYAARAIEILAEKTGAFQVVHSNEMSIFEARNLREFDAVLFNNTTQLKFETPLLRQSLMEFVRTGGGVIGVHAASDNFYEWPEGADLIGGQFDQHPWHSGGTWVVKIDDPSNPVCSAFPPNGFLINDEIYRQRAPYSRGKVRVLASLDLQDERNLDVKGLRPTDVDIPISWLQEFGKGRVFYTVLGHNPHIYWDPNVLKHYLAGIQFALGDLAANATIPYEDFLSQISQYQFGQDRSPLTYLADYIVEIADDRDKLLRAEKQMSKVLKSDASLPGKQFICRQLSIVGTKESVPVLATMLTDPSTSNMALYALARIEDEKAGKVLEKALSNSTGKVKIGIINALGSRRDARSVSRLRDLILDKDQDVAAAAASALGEVGGMDAAKALKAALGLAPGTLRTGIADAYLKCADQFVAHGRISDALEIYEALDNPKEQYSIRLPAFVGRVRTDEDNSVDILLDVLHSDETDLHSAASSLVKELESIEGVVAVSRALPELSPEDQARLLAVLSHKRHPAVLQEAIKAADSGHIAVKIAALQALASLGDETVVILLAQTAAGGGEAAETARSSLYRLKGKNVDRFILSELETATPSVKVELIRSIGERRNCQAVDAVLAAAADESGQPQIEAIRVLRIISGYEKTASIAVLLLEPVSESVRSELEKTVTVVAGKIPERNQRAEAILKLLPSVNDIATRASMYRILGNLGDKNALAELRSGLKSEHPDLVLTAINALSQWPNSGPAEDLLETARSAGSEKQRITALRGYVGLIRKSGDQSPGDAVAKLKLAMELAGQPNEMKLILSAMSETGSPSALSMVTEYLQDSLLRPEAEAAAVRIAGDIMGSYPELSLAALQKVIETSGNKALVNQARELLKTSSRFGDYLVAWQLSGPFSDEGNNLLDYRFAPESGSQSVIWRNMPAGTDTSRPWMLDLGKAMGETNSAAYLRCKVYSNSTRSVRLELGSDDGVKVWLNSEEIHRNDANRSLSPASDVVRINLHDGWNDLMLKIVNAGGQWGACARIATLDGGKVSGIRTRPEQKAGDRDL